ncbi:DNA repair protein RecN [Paraneptunicella aestuarii]|uniref:DNA repair protein RecN n=1 Tax=Paraneptunicella aestuarii TaxID=2831148 RepID=UPI001E53D088|nr:DNA repair protein RecN [Paraneptunicella aestuarii]UAA39882.1 DNA repair protein RecN [Paraneptunicella aestuarii]
MLTHLSIKNFAIVRHLDIEFSNNTTAITGETGAGKSIAIDALSLCLGGRAEAGMVRKNADKAEVTATFSLQKNEGATSWLSNNELDDGEEQCILRRVISSEGRSRAWVNGSPVTLQQMKELGLLLVNIHGQHAHQELLKPDMQRITLDNSAQHSSLLEQVQEKSTQFHALSRKLKGLQDEQQQRADRKSLLQYQLQELDDFALAENEFPELEAEFKKLSHSQTLLEDTQICLHKLYESDHGSALSIVDEALDKLSSLVEHDPQLSPIVQMLTEAQIQVQEASNELRHYVEHLEIDPMKMQQTDERYSKAMELARKHSVLPEFLASHHQGLHDELATLQQQDNDLESIIHELETLKSGYFTLAKQLHTSRQKSGGLLAQQVTEKLHKMNMPHAQFEIKVTAIENPKISAIGTDDIRFMLTSNKGMEADSIEKVASGGELSRISLAIQVLANRTSATMIFDEVDTGISGATASVVGKLLRELGENNQVLCVTHLPQVAAKAHQQMLVTKFTDKDITETHMQRLSEDKRVEELARLLAGDEITESALQNAKGLLHS